MSFPQALVLWFVALGISAHSQAMERVLTGVVQDSLGGTVASTAITVTCTEDTFETLSDASGTFRITQLPAEQCRLRAERNLFVPVIMGVDLTNETPAFVKVVLIIAEVTTEVTVTPGRGRQEQLFEVPEAVSVTTQEELESRPYQILPQALREEPGVLVQQTTTAQGSPFIRGFSAQRIVYLLDGVRFNTSTYRTGATQYLGWINPSLVDRVEIVRGPSSVQYGSDALGGTINVLSLEPALSDRGRHTNGNLEIDFGSADLSAGGNANIVVQTPAAAVRFGGSSRSIGELRTGRSRDSHSALTRFLGLPSKTRYRRLPDTNFIQSGGYMAATFRAGAQAKLNAVYLHEEQSGVSRFDRLLGGDGRHRNEFDPQRLDFGYLRYERAQTGFFDQFTASVSVNRQQDDRLEQHRPTSRIEHQKGRVLALGYQAQGNRLFGGRHIVTVGGEIYDEYIAGTRTFEEPTTGVLQSARPRIPDGTRYTSSGVFAQTTSELIPGRFNLRAGLRYGYFLFRTKQDPTFGIERKRVPTKAVTFNTGGVVNLTEAINATFTVSRGFRAANAFDLGAIGLSGGGFELSPESAASFGAIIGNTDGSDATTTGQPVTLLRPESVIAFEGGLKFRTARLTASINVFDLELRHAIQRRTAIFAKPIVGTTVAGFAIVEQDDAGRAFIKESFDPIVTRVNVDRSRVVGFEADAHFQINRAWRAAAYFSTATGHDLEAGTAMRRMPPPFGGLRVRWQSAERHLWLEGLVTLAFAQNRLSPGDLKDARIGAQRSRKSIAEFFTGTGTDIGLVVDGHLLATGENLAQVQQRLLGTTDSAPLFTKTPGFTTVGARTGWRVTPNLELVVIADNLTDRNYRWHGSGVDAPGFNVQVQTQYAF